MSANRSVLFETQDIWTELCFEKSANTTIKWNKYYVTTKRREIKQVIDYFYKDINGDEISYLKVKTGDTIFTPDNEIHATYFPIKTRLIVSSKFPRDQITYEQDTVRFSLITQDNIKDMLAKLSNNAE